MNENELFLDDVKLPNKLSKEKLVDLFEKVYIGDENAKKKIIEHNIKLVLYRVEKRFKNIDYDKKDLVSIGIIGLIKAIDNFDISKNIAFATFATRCIDNEILMHLRKIKKFQNVELFDDVINTDKDGNELKVNDILKDETVDIEEQYEKKEYEEKYIAKLYKILDVLKKRDREVIIWHFGLFGNEIHTQEWIAKKLGISRSYVSRIVQRVLNDMKRMLEDDNIDLENKKSQENKKDKKQLYNDKLANDFSNYTKEEISKVLDYISENRRNVFILYYGIDSNKSFSYKEIMEKLNLTKEQVYNFLFNAKKDIREILENKKSISEKQLSIDTLIKFFDKPESEILNAMNLLKPINKEIIELRYGLNGNELLEISEIAEKFSLTEKQVNAGINNSKNRLKNILEGKVKFKLDKTDKYASQSIIIEDKLKVDFPGYSKEEIIHAAQKLKGLRKEIFYLVYGLENNKPLSYKEIMKKLNLTYKNTTQSFYNAKKAVISNLCSVVKNETTLTKDENKEMIPNKSSVDEENTAVYKDSDEQNNITPIYKDADKEVEIKFIPKEFNIPALSNFSENKENFRVLINLLSNPTQQVILLLSLGYVEDRCYSVDEISKLLGIESEKVIEIINDGLSNITGFTSLTLNGVESARKQLRMRF